MYYVKNKVVLERVILQSHPVTDVTDFIFQNMDKGQLTGAVFLDLKRAFDTTL